MPSNGARSIDRGAGANSLPDSLSCPIPQLRPSNCFLYAFACLALLSCCVLSLSLSSLRAKRSSSGEGSLTPTSSFFTLYFVLSAGFALSTHITRPVFVVATILFLSFHRGNLVFP